MVDLVGEATARCGSCGNDLRARARFCDACGSAVAPRPATGEHKQVTVLFADVVGSMKLATTLDAERLRDIMNELFNRAGAVVQRYQGTVDKFTGDGLMALFGAPLALEDHALRACISALEIQRVTAELAAEVLRRDGVALQLRVGLNSGEVVAGEIGLGPGRYTAVGHTVGMAQRMEGAARAGGVLCSLSTASLVQDATRLGPVQHVTVKGGDAPVPARELISVESDRMVVGRTEGLMLGRDAELGSLQDVFDARRGCLVGIVGAPGVGKSRLISEFTAIAESRQADIVVARCDAHATALAFRALARLLRAMFMVNGLSDDEAREQTTAQLGQLLTPHSADAQILFEAMGIADSDAPPLQLSVDGRRRRLVDVLAQAVRVRSARTVFVLEDAQWIDEPSDDVLAGFAATLNATESMFVATYRPEFHGALQHLSDRTITIEPLTDSVAIRVAGQILGEDPSLGGLAARIAAVTAGNPFFVEEIVRDLAGRGVLSGSRGEYSLMDNVDEIAVPATVQAVLAARIDRLASGAKSILNAAAVIGSRFDVDTLQTLLPEMDAMALAELVSAELVDQTEFVPQQRYCFHHPLVRTVAYESQLSATRARAHSRLATAIRARETSCDENAGLIATHLEAAGELSEAYRWHMRAAEWLRPRDLSAARAEWEGARRVADRLPGDGDEVLGMRLAPRTMLVSTTLYVGTDANTDAMYHELHDLATRTGDLQALSVGLAGRMFSFAVNDDRFPEAVALAPELQEMADNVQFELTAKGVILNALAFFRFANCEFGAALESLDAITSLATEVPAIEFAPAVVLRGVVETCLGDFHNGRRHRAQGTLEARALPAVNYASVQIYSALMGLTFGIDAADDVVDDTRAALRRAESFGDISGIIMAQWAHGTVLMRMTKAQHDEALDMLVRSRTNIEQHRLCRCGLPAIATDLALDAARNGAIDEAIEELRTVITAQASGPPIFGVFPREALVELLITRGYVADLAEARQIVDRWRARRPGIPALDLWWVRSRALLAKAQGSSSGYADLAMQYLELCEKLDARGRLTEARRLVEESTSQPRVV